MWCEDSAPPGNGGGPHTTRPVGDQVVGVDAIVGVEVRHHLLEEEVEGGLQSRGRRAQAVGDVDPGVVASHLLKVDHFVLAVHPDLVDLELFRKELARKLLTAPHARRQGGDGRFAPAARAPINLRALPQGAQMLCASKGSVRIASRPF